MDMVSERELLMERCSPEKMKETATAAATAVAATLGPFFFLGDGAAMQIDLPLKTAAKGEKFSWCPLT